MKLAKRNVLFINVLISYRDKYGNCYSRVNSAFIIKPEKNEKVYLTETITGYHTSLEQIAKEYIKKVFGMDINYLSEHKNIIVAHRYVTYKELNK